MQVIYIIQDDISIETKTYECFQKDEAPTHNAITVHIWYIIIVPTMYFWKSMGKNSRETVEWPPKSSNIKPLDF